MLELYENIKKRREELGLSQQDLADLLGYKSRSTIAKIESGENDIPQSKIIAFAKALLTSPGKLMGWNDDNYFNKDEIQDSDYDSFPPDFSRYSSLNRGLEFLMKVDPKYVDIIITLNKLNKEGLDKVIDYINDIYDNEKYVYIAKESYSIRSSNANGFFLIEYDEKGNVLSKKCLE